MSQVRAEHTIMPHMVSYGSLEWHFLPQHTSESRCVCVCMCVRRCPATCWLRTNFLVSALATLWIPMWGCVWEQGIEWKSDWMKGSAEHFPPFTSSVCMWLIGAPRVMKGFECAWFCLHRKCGILCTLPH